MQDKNPIANMQPTRAKISRRIRAVWSTWSELSLFISILQYPLIRKAGNECQIDRDITKTHLLLKLSPTKTESFQIKNSNTCSFYISAQNIDCGYSLEPPRRGDSKEYPQSMFLSRNKENNEYPCKPQFYYIKMGFKGSKLYRYVFVMDNWQKAKVHGATQ